MIIVDLHSDSLTKVSGNVGLIKSYNFSSEYPHLQLAAAYVPSRGREPLLRRSELLHYFNVYLSELARLGIAAPSCAEDIYAFEKTGGRAVIFSVEGGAGLFADSRELSVLAESGLRVFGMAWDKNELAASAFDECDTGLSDEGRALLSQLDGLGVISDVSHLSDKSFYQLMEASSYPVIATHSNFREICKTKRNLTLDMARSIVSRGGVIGLSLYPPHLSESDEATEDDILRHVDFALEHLGEGALAFGFDIDGTDGKYPKGISEVRSIHDQVVELLLRHYSEKTVERIAGRNALDFLKSNLL